MRTVRLTLVAFCLLALDWTRSGAQEKTRETPRAEVKLPEGSFVVKPYLQLGHSPRPGCLRPVWHTDLIDAEWAADYRYGRAR